MSFLESQLAPILVVLSLLGIGLGFFRHILIKILTFLFLEIALFVAFPQIQIWLAQLVGLIRGILK